MALIHEITIENFRSIRDELVLDFRIPKTSPDMTRFRVSKSNPAIRLPTVVAFFGANGAGKTTVLRALTETMSFVAYSFNNPPDVGVIGLEPFRHTETGFKPLKISIELDANWVLPDIYHTFRYELEIIRKPIQENPEAKKTIAREALYYAPKGQMRRIFERIEGEAVKVSKELELKEGDDRLKKIRNNCSVISHLAQFDNDFALNVRNGIGIARSNIWSGERDEFKLHDENFAKHLASSDDILKAYNNLVRQSDFGIEKISVSNTPQGPVAEFHHKGIDIIGYLFDESQGTRNFLNLASILKVAIDQGTVALFDELDNDLHPALLKEILNWYLSPESNEDNAQLFFTAHNSSLLENLEKEEVFLVEKDDESITDIYRLMDIKGIRREPDLQKMYMGGALGALPRLG